MNPGRAVPSPHRAVPGARSFSMNRTPAPQPAADADGAYCLHVQRHATAANDRSRLVFRTSDRCTYAGDRNRILSRDPNISRFRPASIPESARESIFPFQNAYFSNMYKFAVQVSPGRRRKESRNRPGRVRHFRFLVRTFPQKNPKHAVRQFFHSGLIPPGDGLHSRARRDILV